MKSSPAQRSSPPIWQPSVNHWTLRAYKERCTKRQYQQLLLDRGWEFKNGTIHDWKGKLIDAGIYEIWLEERP